MVNMSEYQLPVKLDKGKGAPLILLHGLGNNHKSWEYVLEHLDYDRWRAITVDLLGFGDAPKPDIDYTPSDHAKAVIALLDSLDIESATFVGHSMGCLVAIEIMTQYSNRVKSLVLLGAPIYRKKPRGGWLHKIIQPEGRYFSLFEIVKKHPDAVQVGGKIADEIVPFVKGLEITEETWSAYKKSLENTIMQCESFGQAKRSEVPILFVNGLLDNFIIRRNTRALRHLNPRYIKIKNTLGPHELTPRQGKTIARIIYRWHI